MSKKLLFEDKPLKKEIKKLEIKEEDSDEEDLSPAIKQMLTIIENQKKEIEELRKPKLDNELVKKKINKINDVLDKFITIREKRNEEQRKILEEKLNKKKEKLKREKQLQVEPKNNIKEIQDIKPIEGSGSKIIEKRVEIPRVKHNLPTIKKSIHNINRILSEK